MACAPRPAPVRGVAAAELTASAAAHYQAYGQALATPQREAIAAFYHPDGVLLVLNGASERHSRAVIDRRYREQWSPPAYFAWDDLTFDSIGPGQVLVNGGFRWQSAGQQDTVPFIYAALLVAVDSGMAIAFEHETLRPRR